MEYEPIIVEQACEECSSEIFKFNVCGKWKFVVDASQTKFIMAWFLNRNGLKLLRHIVLKKSDWNVYFILFFSFLSAEYFCRKYSSVTQFCMDSFETLRKYCRKMPLGLQFGRIFHIYKVDRNFFFHSYQEKFFSKILKFSLIVVLQVFFDNT